MDGSNIGNRDQAARNAMTQFQAVYGGKPQEARQVKKTLDKDDFMRIMITEMKNQDPTKPMDSDRMATQMAQLTSVEQMKNMGTAIEKLADKNNSSDRLAMSALIGKSVTVDKGRFSHQKGTISPINYNLPVNASKVRLVVLDERGEEVASRELDPQLAGGNVYNWDGLNASRIPVDTGNYIVRVDAEDEKGAPIKIDPISKERIVGVSFEGGGTNFLVGNPQTPQRVSFNNVIRMEGSSERLPAEAAQPNSAGSNEAFPIPEALRQKLGVYGEAFDEKAENPEAKQVAEVETAAPVKPVGFANGLDD